MTTTDEQFREMAKGIVYIKRLGCVEPIEDLIFQALQQVRRETAEDAAKILADRCVCGNFGDCGYCELALSIRKLRGEGGRT